MGSSEMGGCNGREGGVNEEFGRGGGVDECTSSEVVLGEAYMHLLHVVSEVMEDMALAWAGG